MTLAIVLASFDVGLASIAYAPIGKTIVNTEYDHIPQYTYSYGVDDPTTGDSKSQTETRIGDVVTGQYSLLEPDGSKRIVDYTADADGFKAVVRKALPALPVAYTAPVVAKIPSIAYSNPVVSKVVAPLSYTAPVVGSQLNSIAYTPSITKAIIQAPTSVNHGTPLIYSPHLGKSIVAASPSSFIQYSSHHGYTPTYTQAFAYPKLHY